MGLTNAAVLATKLITHFKPKYIAMVGIAAGIDAKTQKVGDILYASHTYDLAMGKLEGKGLLSNFKPKIYQVSAKDNFDHFPSLLAAIQEKDLLNEVKTLWNNKSVSYPLEQAPQLHIGPFGSVGTVIADPKEVNIFKKVNNALIGFDMEAHAIVTASVECGLAEKPQVVIFKSICDFAGKDKTKMKDFKQNLAAFTSAQFLRLFFLKYVFPS
jgi:nucleoside phosphorylase